MSESNAGSHCQELLPWYAAGTLLASERAQVERHIDSCVSCAYELAQWQMLGNTNHATGQSCEPVLALADSWQRLSARIAVAPPAPAPLANRLHQFWQIFWRQTQLLQPAMWLASAGAIALATLSALVLSQAAHRSTSANNLLTFALPLISGAGMGLLYGPENDPGLELGRATATSPRVIVLSRFALLLGFNLVLALLATLLLVAVQGGGFWALTALWLGPMTLLSAAALAISLLLGPVSTVGIVTLFWLANIVRVGNGVHMSPSPLTNGQILVPLLILGFALLLGALWLASRQEHLPTGASDAVAGAAFDTPPPAIATAMTQYSSRPDLQPVQHEERSLMHQLSTLSGVFRYEFLMQIRRLALWVIALLIGALNLIQFLHPTNYTHNANLPFTHTNIVIIEAAGAANFFWLGAGLLLAGRSRRDRTTKVDEILDTTPATMLSRLFGKYLGNVLAMLVPMVLIFLIGFTLLALNWHDFSIFPLALAGFLLFVVPAVLFVGAFSMALTTVIWPPLYMFLFIGYYLWESLDPKGPIPTLNGSILSPSNRLVMTGIFHFTPFRTADLSYYPTTSVWGGIANIAALLLAGMLVLLAAWGLAIWRQSRG